MKKRVEDKGISKVKKSPLSGAIKDLGSEIRSLSKERIVLKANLKSVSSSLDGDHDKERELQKKIARLIEKEASLNKKKKTLQAEVDRVSDKVNKISKIKSEMSDI